MASSGPPGNNTNPYHGAADFTALTHRVAQLEGRLRATERIIAFAATRITALLLLCALVIPAVTVTKSSGGSDTVTTERIVTIPFMMFGDVGTIDGSTTIPYAICIGFLGLALVALWCCARLLFLDTRHGQIGTATVVAAWLLAIGSGIALLMLLLFSGMSEGSDEDWSIGPAPWLLALAAVFVCGLFIPKPVRRWITGNS